MGKESFSKFINMQVNMVFDKDKKYGRKSSGRSGGRRSFGSGRPDRRGSERQEYGRSPRTERKEMHRITCDECGNKAEVPFKPTTSKPVYCSDCFKKNEDSDSRPRRQSNNSSKDLAEINEKLDKILNLLES